MHCFNYTGASVSPIYGAESDAPLERAIEGCEVTLNRRMADCKVGVTVDLFQRQRGQRAFIDVEQVGLLIRSIVASLHGDPVQREPTTKPASDKRCSMLEHAVPKAYSTTAVGLNHAKFVQRRIFNIDVMLEEDRLLTVTGQDVKALEGTVKNAESAPHRQTAQRDDLWHTPTICENEALFKCAFLKSKISTSEEALVEIETLFEGDLVKCRFAR